MLKRRLMLKRRCIAWDNILDILFAHVVNILGLDLFNILQRLRELRQFTFWKIFISPLL